MARLIGPLGCPQARGPGFTFRREKLSVLRANGARGSQLSAVLRSNVSSGGPLRHHDPTVLTEPVTTRCPGWPNQGAASTKHSRNHRNGVAVASSAPRTIVVNT